MELLLAIIALIFSAIAYNRVSNLEKVVKRIQTTGVQATPFMDQSLEPPSPISKSEDLSSQSGATSSPVSASEDVVSSQQNATQFPGSSSSTQQVSAQTVLQNESNVIEQFFHWLAVDWLMKLGAVLLFLGIIWFVNVAVWDAIGETGRVLIGVMVGVSILVFGHVWIAKYVNQGTVLEGLGAGVMLFTMYVAQESYHFFPPVVALGFLFLVSVFVAFSSVVNGSQALALLGIVLGGVAPFLIGSSEANFIGLFSYLFVISIGTLWVVRIRGWRPLIFAAFLAYFFYSLPYIFGAMEKVSIGEGMLVALVFATLFFVSNIWAALKSEKMHQADMVTASANALLLLGWINALVPADWKGLVTAVCALAFCFGAALVFRLRGNGVPVMLYTAVAGMMFGVATTFEFSGPMLVVALTLEVGILVTATIAFARDISAANIMMYLFLIPIYLSVMNIGNYSVAKQVFTVDFFALVLLGGALFLTARLFRTPKDDSEQVTKYHVFTAVGSLYFLLLIWLGLGNLLYPNRDLAVTISLVIYTIIGLTLYIFGKLNAARGKMYSGAALLLFVVGYLLLVSVREMEIVGRIVTFSLVGILLMSTAFIGRWSRRK